MVDKNLTTKGDGNNISSEIMKIHQYEFILSLIKSMNPQSISDFDDERVKKFQRFSIIVKYLKSIDSEDTLGIDLTESGSLTHTEKKLLHEYLSNKITKELQKIFEFINNENRFNTVTDNSNVKLRNDIIDLEERYKNLILELYNVKMKKFNLVKNCLNLKFNSNYLMNELNLLLKKYEVNVLKANIMKNMIVRKFLNQTEHTTKAIEKIEKNLDLLLEK